ncbi:diguanylate cyclase domain-containing protein [Amphritea sp.]|uniref:diguanylate cyclase domain-containing protein n=1 Tax=Amphritea sp. TaxID=1872502 RepID=UPI003A93F12F
MNDQQDDIYKTLLESTKAIPWRVCWETKTFEYIGPQIEALLGWPQDSWVTENDWLNRIHEDDREKCINDCIASSRFDDYELDYRALTATGESVWVRDVVHVVREDDGAIKALIGFVFDISDRKALEDDLQRANKKLEVLSFQDGLTGVANWRLYDQTLAREWAHAVRNDAPLSLIVVDIDQFKDYNDRFGHLLGDEGLKSVAKALQGVATRSTDFIARYGGEEFVLLLPDTGRESAYDIAQCCLRAVLDLSITHPGAEAGHFLSISAGVACVQPRLNGDRSCLFETADRMLYEAKRSGRNKVVCSWPQEIARQGRELN